jgi:hypothetical protein
MRPQRADDELDVLVLEVQSCVAVLVQECTDIVDVAALHHVQHVSPPVNTKWKLICCRCLEDDEDHRRHEEHVWGIRPHLVPQCLCAPHPRSLHRMAHEHYADT